MGFRTTAFYDITHTSDNGIAIYEDPNLPGFYFEYDADIWKREILDGLHPGQFFDIRLIHKILSGFLSIKFNLPLAGDFVDCTRDFYEGDLILISDFVLAPIERAKYQYFDKSQFHFRTILKLFKKKQKILSIIVTAIQLQTSLLMKLSP